LAAHCISTSSSCGTGDEQSRRHLPEIHGTTVLCVRKDDQVCSWREWVCVVSA
jgi:hypothetical protein